MWIDRSGWGGGWLLSGSRVGDGDSRRSSNGIDRLLGVARVGVAWVGVAWVGTDWVSGSALGPGSVLGSTAALEDEAGGTAIGGTIAYSTRRTTPSATASPMASTAATAQLPVRLIPAAFEVPEIS
jgi:hypothetical protein